MNKNDIEIELLLPLGKDHDELLCQIGDVLVQEIIEFLPTQIASVQQLLGDEKWHKELEEHNYTAEASSEWGKMPRLDILEKRANNIIGTCSEQLEKLPTLFDSLIEESERYAAMLQRNLDIAFTMVEDIREKFKKLNDSVSDVNEWLEYEALDLFPISVEKLELQESVIELKDLEKEQMRERLSWVKTPQEKSNDKVTQRKIKEQKHQIDLAAKSLETELLTYLDKLAMPVNKLIECMSDLAATAKELSDAQRGQGRIFSMPRSGK